MNTAFEYIDDAQTDICTGCGIATEKTTGPVHRYLVSSPGCWAMFGDVLAREYENYEYMSVHALTVDAYALQHPGSENLQTINSAHAHLASLYSYFRLGKPTSELPKVKQDVTRLKSQFEWLTPPEDITGITVADILKADTASQHRAVVLEWANYVFDEWKDHHKAIATLLSA